MSTIDVDKLLEELDPDEPVGPSLEYDPLFLEMEQAAQGRAEQEVGGESIAAEPPAWHEVGERALELASRTRDLRVGVYLARAAVRTDGFAGLGGALRLLVGYIERYWDTAHPQLEDDLDPTMRLNAMAALQDPSAMLRAVQEAILVRSPVVGAIAFRDVMVARGDAAPAGDEEAPTEAMINGVMAECDLEELQEAAEACAEAHDAGEALHKAVAGRLEGGFVIDLGPLTQQIGHVKSFLQDQLAARGVGSGSGEVEAEEGSGPIAAESGAIRSRDDVVRTLERICRYYEVHEPSSPLPMLMERAKRLVHANFLEVIRDLAPDGVDQVANVGGIHQDVED